MERLSTILLRHRLLASPKPRAKLLKAMQHTKCIALDKEAYSPSALHSLHYEPNLNQLMEGMLERGWEYRHTVDEGRFLILFFQKPKVYEPEVE